MKKKGILSAIHPTIALTNISGLNERKVLARRYHIHTLLTCHQPRQVNLSQNSSFYESMIIAQRYQDNCPPTRIISLDRMPIDGQEVNELHHHLIKNKIGTLPNGWGEVSEWQAEQIKKGDWSAVAFRSPILANAALEIENDVNLLSFSKQKISPRKLTIGKKNYTKCSANTSGSFPVIYLTGEEAQTRIKGEPDQYFVEKNSLQIQNSLNIDEGNRKNSKLMQNAAHLLVAFVQNTTSARLTAVANEIKYVGYGWMPVHGLSLDQAKSLAVFMNSTAGRLQLLRIPGQTINWPKYNPGAYEDIRIPDLENEHRISLLATCWDATQHMIVPQYRDGECKVRRMWDEAVAEALGWNLKKLTEWRKLLHMEPHVRGLGRNQYGE